MDRIPCRVSQDLTGHNAALDRAELDQPEFDALNDDDCREAAGKILAEPIQKLLMIEYFGIEKHSIAEIQQAIRDLHEAMKTAYTEGL